MKKIVFAALMLTLPQFSFAATSGAHIFMCKVLSFDKKEVKGQCDPYKPKNTYKIPREWIAEDESLKVNNRVKFVINGKQLEEWIALNNLEMPKGKSK